MKWKHKEACRVLMMSLGRVFPYYSENMHAEIIRVIPGLKTIDNAKRFVSIFLVNWPRDFVIGKFYVWPSDTELIQIGFDSVKRSIFTESTHCKGNFYLVKDEVDPSEEDR